MAEETINLFELDTVTDKENGVLAIQGGYENTLAIALTILEQHPVFVIDNDTDKKRAKEIRANLNKVVKAIDRKRIDSITDFTIEFTEQCNNLKELFSKRANEFAEVINQYEESQKLASNEAVATKKYVATIKFTDEKIIKKLTDFCTKNNCELSIK